MTPASIHDPGLNSVSILAELIFTKLFRCVDARWRASGDPEVIRGMCLAKRHSVRATQVAHCLEELQAAGAIVYLACSTDGKSQIEIADHLKDHAAPPAPHQTHLGLGPLGLPRVRESLHELIHNPAGLSPPDRQKLLLVAATAVSVSDLIARLREHFPRHDVATEWRRYRAHREKHKRPVIASKFIDWMLRAEPELKPDVRRQTSEVRTASAKLPVPSSDQPDLFDDIAHRRFLEVFEQRKLRKSA
jgi:hypothetical protein